MKTDSLTHKFKNNMKKCHYINNLYTKYKWRERKVSYGNDNPDKTFYVIRRARCQCGLFSYVTTNLGRIKYAIDRGYIPVIDMQNENNTYLDDDRVGCENSWEYYFEQPCGYSLKDIKHSKNVILGNGLIDESFDYPDKLVPWDENEYSKWHDISLKYLRIKKELIDNFKQDEDVLSYDGLNKRLIGVLARGTDYITLKPHEHPIQPSVDELSAHIANLLETGGYDGIYLATEDADIYETLKEHFKDKLYAPNVVRYSRGELSNINNAIIERDNDRYLKGEEYLKSMWMLTQCKAFIAGNVSGTVGVLLLNENYEYKYIFNKGLYD